MNARGAACAFVLWLLTALATLPAVAEELDQLDGAQLFKRFCASCHGAEGRGDGPVAGMLNVMVPDLTRMPTRQGGTFSEQRVLRIIDGRRVVPADGTREMPVWGFEFRLASAEHADAVARTGRILIHLRIADWKAN